MWRRDATPVTTERARRTVGVDAVTDDPEDDGSEFSAKRRAILDTAAEVFSRRGFQGGTTKEIAEAVGLSQPSIYHYVGSKDDLIREIALQCDRDMTAALERGISRSDDPRDQLRGVITEFTAAVVLNRKTFAVFWKEQHALPVSVRAQTDADERWFVQRIIQLVGKVQEQGLLAPAQPAAVVAESILGMVSWLYHWYRPEGPLDASGLAASFLDLLGLPAAASSE